MSKSTDCIPIPRKGGPLDGKPFQCFKSIHEYLEEGQLVKASFRVSGPFPNRLYVKQLTYCLQKDGKDSWELIYVPDEPTQPVTQLLNPTPEQQKKIKNAVQRIFQS